LLSTGLHYMVMIFFYIFMYFLRINMDGWMDSGHGVKVDENQTPHRVCTRKEEKRCYTIRVKI